MNGERGRVIITDISEKSSLTRNLMSKIATSQQNTGSGKNKKKVMTQVHQVLDS